MVNQVGGTYKCTTTNTMMLCKRVIELCKRFDDVIIQHIPIEANEVANKLAQTTSGYKIYVEAFLKGISIGTKVLQSCEDRKENLEVSMLRLSQQTKDWREEVILILKSPLTGQWSNRQKLNAQNTSCGGKSYIRKTIWGICCNA